VPAIPSFTIFVLIWIALALILFPIQFFVTAPYGRHVRAGWGPGLPNRLGWFVMEAVSLVLFAALFLSGGAPKTPATWIFFALWVAHYGNRSLIFPWRTKTRGKIIPLGIVLGAVSFNLVNAGLNGFYLGSLAHYPATWLIDPRFIMGLAIFFVGAAINIWADGKLIALRKNDGGYAIPRGGLFERISCPNLFGEIVEWFGFAILCWNLPAFSFAIWTAANLIPRARSHHAWYCSHFADYPPGRRAVIPFLL
jgi:hypothetical protein